MSIYWIYADQILKMEKNIPKEVWCRFKDASVSKCWSCCCVATSEDFNRGNIPFPHRSPLLRTIELHRIIYILFFFLRRDYVQFFREMIVNTLWVFPLHFLSFIVSSFLHVTICFGFFHNIQYIFTYLHISNIDVSLHCVSCRLQHLFNF